MCLVTICPWWNLFINGHVTPLLTIPSPKPLRDKAKRMGEMKVYLPEELDARFRKAAMGVYGYGRGSISKAAVEAFSKWCAEHETLMSVGDSARGPITEAEPSTSDPLNARTKATKAHPERLN